MKLKESFKDAHQWYSEVIPKITVLQGRVAVELTRISTLKAIAIDKYNVEGSVKVISEKKRKNARKEKRNKSKQTGSSLNNDVQGVDGTQHDKGQKLMSSCQKRSY